MDSTMISIFSRRFRQCAAMAAVLLGTATGTPVLAADLANGARIYGVHCVACHGIGGRNVMPQAPNFARGERLMQMDMNLVNSLKMGKNACPSFLGILRDREMLDVIGYLRTLRG